MPLALTEFPVELLEQIISHIETAQALSRLSLTCKGIYALIDKDGYRIFIKSRFPSIPVPPPTIPGVDDEISHTTPKFWKDAARGITTQSRDWDRRAFTARRIGHPSFRGDSEAVGNARRRRQGGQSIGFTPVIDSYEAWYGGDWASRREILGWGAGAGLIIRSRIMGRGALESDSDERPSHGHEHRWTMYRPQGMAEGRDDITSLNLLPQPLEEREEFIVGRRSGTLERVRLDANSNHTVICTYDTYGFDVMSATTHHSNKDSIAVCLSDATVALYPIGVRGREIRCIAQTSLRRSGGNVRTWTSNFLKDTRFVVGLGRSTEPIHVHDLAPHGVADLDHGRALSLDGEPLGDRLDAAGAIPNCTSVYSIAPLSSSSTSGGAEGDIFLSGAYDANVRLHDLRLFSTVVSRFSDPVDASSAIYSLVPIGRERFIAGGQKHSLLKVFDLRMPGQKVYHAADSLPCPPSLGDPNPSAAQSRPIESRSNNSKRCGFHNSIRTRRSWNVFLNPRYQGYEYSLESPVYALSRPSSISPTIYAGIQNRVMQFDLASVLDRHPDPIYGSNSLYSKQKIDSKAVVQKWDPDQEVMSLPMYDQDTKVTLRHQQPVLLTGVDAERQPGFEGLDERWGDASVKEDGRWGDIRRRGR